MIDHFCELGEYELILSIFPVAILMMFVRVMGVVVAGAAGANTV